MVRPSHAPKRFISLGTKLALATTGVLVLGSSLLFLELTGRERQSLVSAKQTAASMVASLFSASVSAPLVFGDSDAIEGELNNLKTNPEISAAAIWVWGESDPTAEWHKEGTVLAGPPADKELGQAKALADRVEVSRVVLNPMGKPIGKAALIFSLDTENQAYNESRKRIFWLSFALAGGTAILLFAIARRQIILPLAQLVDAAQRLERGELGARVIIKSNDEIAQLMQAFNTMGVAVADREQRFAKELEIAVRIQTSILPQNLEVAGLEIAAHMIPASEVGGDYYDVLSLESGDGCWLGIGDVSGHGLNSGLIMLMIQSVVSGLVRNSPDDEPRNIVRVLNEVLFDNIRLRLSSDNHATLSLFRYHRNGHVVFAGSHEDILVCRAATGKVEIVDTPGTWVGAMRNVERFTTDTSLQLCDGDVMLLYTDGVTEAMNAESKQFGIERLCAELERVHADPVEQICNHMIDSVMSWMAKQDDDITLLVVRHQVASHPQMVKASPKLGMKSLETHLSRDRNLVLYDMTGDLHFTFGIDSC